MERHDYAYPFRIDGDSRRAQQSPYATHVRQMIRQVLLTSPGERVDLPEFGCGLRQLIFAPHSEALEASVKILILQSLNKWLGSQISVKDVRVGGDPDAGELRIDIDYLLVETQSADRTAVLVR
jgi:phage baseplate assembly protein W